MPANSLPRRLLKFVLSPLLNEGSYRIVQSVAKGWDIRSGSWTEPELDLIRYGVRSGETAIDIGANFGLYSYHLSRAVGPSGKVFAFEPIPFTSETFKLTARMLRFSSNTELFAVGCGKEKGELTFTVPISESGAIISGLVHMGARDDQREGKSIHAKFDQTKEVKCPVVKVDDIVGNRTNVSFLKCDVEGADYFALMGSREVLAREHPTVICEMNPWFMEGFGVTVADLVGFMRGLGYALYRYETGRLIPTATEDVYEDNWIFVHPSRKSRFTALLPPEA